MALQIGSGLLEACVLSVLAEGDIYGYQLTQQIRAHFDISESTLYPVLRRLQKDGALETYDEPFQGRNRRYYRLTAEGRALSEDYRTEWMEFREKIDGFLAKGEQHDKE